MIATVTSEYAPDALDSLRESFALHLSATRADKTTRIYLDALDRLHRAPRGGRDADRRARRPARARRVVLR